MALQAETFIPQRVLVVMAHPDDIEFGAAGSIAHWVEQGAQVTYCIVTNGAAGSNDPSMDMEVLIETRQEEQRQAAAKVGVQDVRFLGYQDGALQPTMELRRELTRLIRQLKPDRVVAFDPTCIIAQEMDYINHPDHRASAEATLYAVFPSAETRPIFPELLAEGLEPHKVLDMYLVLTDHPNTYVDITAQHERKLEALACHATQNITPEVLGMVRQWGGEAGQKLGLGAAEVFRVLNFRPTTNGHTEGESSS
jgi:LmbE family N-acetylglucosaminyl deacetylase